jgi:two-component system response regulator PilR (NtrC family)
LADLERRYLEAALIRTKGAKKKAAEMLGMNFRSFRYRLQKFGLGDEQEQTHTDS